MLFQYETDRLVLKVLTPESAPMVLDFYNRDRELFEKYEIERSPEFYSVAYLQKVLRYEYNLFQKGTLARYYVFLKCRPSQIIGTVCLHNITRTAFMSCEIGYKFSSQYHHQGYATEAINRCMNIAFYEIGLHRITATVCFGNKASAKILENLGFSVDGILRDYLILNGRFTDHALYSCLSTDYRPISSLHNQ
ncbi:MAG: GNAT family N-acetyltransferase [Lachnospiraceae bacterium]|nr:GNAT family N-acetyltransferase [Lachnospiraceae bacterium]MEE1100292.1 GNAT family protein [Agathobacter sp.]